MAARDDPCDNVAGIVWDFMETAVALGFRIRRKGRAQLLANETALALID